MRKISDKEKLEAFGDVLDSVDREIADYGRSDSVSGSLAEMSALDCRLRETLSRYRILTADVFPSGAGETEAKTEELRLIVQRIANITTVTRLLRERLLAQVHDEIARQFPAN